MLSLAPKRDFKNYAGVAQLVEHQLPKLRVAGSNPVARFFGGPPEPIALPLLWISRAARMLNIAILSAKGGTGKTTLAIALAHQYALANPEREIVLIDADNQGNVGISLDLRTENTLGAFLFRAADTVDMVRYKPETPFYVVESGRMNLYEAES